MSRDNFKQHTKQQLALAAHYHCVRPGCAQLTHIYNQPTDAMTHFGAAAHDSAAAPGGARYDAELSPEQRKAYENGAWLCMSCATLVDRVEDLFPPGVLADWQREAAAILRDRALQPMPPYMIDIRAVREVAKLFGTRLGNLPLASFNWFTPTLSWSAKCQIEAFVQASRPGGDLHCVEYRHTANLQKRATEDLTAICREMTLLPSKTWWYDNDAYSYQLTRALNTADHEVARTAANKVCMLWADARTAAAELIEFGWGRPSSANFAAW